MTSTLLSSNMFSVYFHSEYYSVAIFQKEFCARFLSFLAFFYKKNIIYVVALSTYQILDHLFLFSSYLLKTFTRKVKETFSFKLVKLKKNELPNIITKWEENSHIQIFYIIIYNRRYTIIYGGRYFSESVSKIGKMLSLNNEWWSVGRIWNFVLTLLD